MVGVAMSLSQAGPRKIPVWGFATAVVLLFLGGCAVGPDYMRPGLEAELPEAWSRPTLAEALPLIIATFFLSGLIEMLFGIVRLGRYIRYIPYPVISGFMSGIGIIIRIGTVKFWNMPTISR